MADAPRPIWNLDDDEEHAVDCACEGTGLLINSPTTPWSDPCREPQRNVAPAPEPRIPRPVNPRVIWRS